MKLGIFGGTFNPIHFGHLRAAEEVRETAGLDRIIFIPSGNPPLKTYDIAPAPDRYKMTGLAIKGNSLFDSLDIESGSRRKSYTVATLLKLKKIYPHDDLYFMLGIDAFLDIPDWHKPELLLSLSNFIIISRPGSRFLDLSASPYLSAEEKDLRKLDTGKIVSHTGILSSGTRALLLNIFPVDISATDIRSHIKQGRSIKYLLPAEVESYIISHKLYAFRKTKDRTLKRICH